MQVKERWKINKSEILVQGEGLARGRGFGVSSGGGRGVDSRLGIIGYTLLEKVGLALERDHIHKVEGIRHGVHLVVAESHEEPVSDELDVLAHELGIHSDESNGEGVSEELLFDGNSLDDNLLDEFGMRTSP